MRLLFIRHGDPDYVNDTLTEKGHREAKLLSDIAEDLKLGSVFQSPLGRAKDTAAYSLRQTGLHAVTLSWLREFPAKVDINGSPELQRAYPDCKKEEDRFLTRIAWDMAPGYFSAHPEYMSFEGWKKSEVARHSDIVEVYENVKTAFLELLHTHGYEKVSGCFHVRQESEETLTFFCHFGIICVLLSVLWEVSPFWLWHSLVLTPTSVTEVITEEREAGIAYFRAQRVGDISHLALGKETPSFAARFCETYHHFDQRH